MQTQTIKVGENYPIAPTNMGFVARLQDEAFQVVGFADNLRASEVREFKSNPIRYGVFRYGATDTGIVPFFLVKIAGSDWSFDVSFNLPQEQAVTRDAFLASDGAALVPLILCDYPSGKVRAIRAITVAADTLNQIRETCRNQTDPEVVDRAINECYLYISLDQMIDDADMRLV